MYDVTICLPMWNAGKTIRRCLAAILAQPLNGAELLVIDNCSDDGCDTLAEELLKSVPNCRVVRNHTNLGRVGNWNRCLDLCDTKYLKFALVNDVLMRGNLKCLTTVAAGNPDAAMVCSRFRMTEQVPPEIPAVDEFPKVQVLAPPMTARFFAEHGCRTGGFNSMLLNMECIRRNGLRFREDIPYCADYYFAIELAAKGDAAFVEADTYLFDSGATGRFHFAGLKQPASFFLEQRECARLLARQTGDSALSYCYLNGQFLWFLGQGARLQVSDAWSTFSGAPFAMRCRAAWTTLKFNLKNRSRGRLDLSPASELGRQ